MSGNHEALNGLQVTEFKKDPESIRYIHMTEKKAKHRAPDFRKKFLIYFILAIFIIMLIGIELIYEVESDGLYKQIAESISNQFPDQADNPDMSEVRSILESLHVRVIMVVSIMFLCFAVSAIMFYCNFVKPVDKMARGVWRMAGGHLNELIPVSSDNEIGKIGELINDLAMNMQEILLHVWNHTGQDIVLMDRIVKVCGSKTGGSGIPDEIKDDLRIVRQDIEDMKTMVKAFDYYNVRFEKEKIIAGEKAYRDKPQKHTAEKIESLATHNSQLVEGEYHD